MTGRWAGRLARRLAHWTGDEGRAAEIRGHLDDAEAAGHPAHLRDVASVSSLVVRRAARDLPWWLAGLPIPVLFAGILAMTYETHFHAWDVVGPDEFARTSTTVVWMRVIETAAIIGVLAGLISVIIGTRAGVEMADVFPRIVNTSNDFPVCLVQSSNVRNTANLSTGLRTNASFSTNTSMT